MHERVVSGTAPSRCSFVGSEARMNCVYVVCRILLDRDRQRRVELISREVDGRCVGRSSATFPAAWADFGARCRCFAVDGGP